MKSTCAGRIYWIEKGQEQEGKAGTAILRSPDELALDCECEGESYSGILRRRADDSFGGSIHRKSDRHECQITCRLYRADKSCALIGEWLESGYEHSWFTELSFRQPDATPSKVDGRSSPESSRRKPAR
jgi:hypothetical protein